MRRPLMFTIAVLSLGLCSTPAQAQIRLIAITGELNTPEFDFSEGPDDETLYELSLTNGAATRLFTPSRSPDTNSIGYNPNDGLIYHLSGSEAYRNTPERWAYNDNQQMETIDPVTFELNGVFNANGPPGEPGSVRVQFGLSAPRPEWVLPAEIRTDEQTDTSFRQKGPNEYSSARGVAWSEADNLFYLTSSDGLFSLTATGQSTFIAPFADAKGIGFAKVAGVSKLFVGTGGDVGDGVVAVLSETNPATGDVISSVEVTDPDQQGYQKILALAGHPVTGVLYGIVQKEFNDESTGRELVTINPTTGVATLVGIPLTAVDEDGDQAAFVSLAFVGYLGSDHDGDGDVDGNDLLVIQRGIGTTHDAGDIAAWKASYGATVGAVASAGAVPEPSALLITVIALGCLGFGRSRLAGAGVRS